MSAEHLGSEALKEDQPPYFGYIYDFGATFLEMTMRPALEDEQDLIELKVWEEPVVGASYVIGVDSASGDFNCISVWRCFADRRVQVAKYCTRDVEVRFVVWVCAHLAGAYDDGSRSVRGFTFRELRQAFGRDALRHLSIAPGGMIVQERA